MAQYRASHFNNSLNIRRNIMNDLTISRNWVEAFDPFKNLTVGFDDMFEQLSELSRFDVPKYPPYNIKKTEDNKYQLELALAGFSKGDLNVEVKDNTLTISGNSTDKEDGGFVYKGIAQRAFTRQWALVDYLKVFNANFKDGVLSVDMELNTPEEKKAKTIEVK
jgi:molecular chaperone IbpA|tara:strand:- start:227 stop:718 length:492 start_codon:yes stop_codon:yes gene_type:complete